MGNRVALEAWFGQAGKVLLGYSGGVDSAVLAVVGTRALGPDRMTAVLGRSASLADAQLEQARALAERFDITLLEVDTAELGDPDYRANRPDRCYFCKRELWDRLGALAAERGDAIVVDGTNADDLREHRPGARAGLEHAVRSPLAELGWTKAAVRDAARALGIPIWDAPSAPCLASRIQYGLEVTPERLRQVELAEQFLRTLGVTGDLRVRHHGSRARIEVIPEMFALLADHRSSIDAALADLGFAAVTVDPAGYRRGSLLPIAS